MAARGHAPCKWSNSIIRYVRLLDCTKSLQVTAMRPAGVHPGARDE